MRQVLGLSPPERRIGQTAHDFVMAMGHERVILSRARKRDGTPMVESRFVQRLAALTGDAFKPAAPAARIISSLPRTRPSASGRAADHTASAETAARPAPAVVSA